MIIGIEEGLEGIKNYLEGLQTYQIYDLGTYQGAMDAIIYDKAGTDDFEAYQFDSMNNALETHDQVPNGTLMIKATHKTGEEVHELLEARNIGED